MIKIQVNFEMYAYDMYHITKAFCPEEEISQKVDAAAQEVICIAFEEERFGGESFRVQAEELEEYTERREKKQYVNCKLYDWLSKKTGKQIAWGTLTGVRPTKLMMSLKEGGMEEADVIRYMEETYRVTEKKARLGMEIARREQELLSRLDYKDGYSLYVGIPFCPTTCSYCSFTSYPLAKWESRVDAYLDALCKELRFIASVSKNKKLNTIYIGGGTPTTLSPKQLDRLLTEIEAHFSFADLQEFTVEAGRPDSITREKLQVLKEHEIGRISINPQTMQQKTLDLVGRGHTVEDIKRVYEMAREIGFDNINMDLIAGLPEETLEDMEDTLQEIAYLHPDSLTVHALAMKRASRMSREKKERQKEGLEDSGKEAKQAEELEAMIERAAEYAAKMDLVPYYMYRQKNIAGNFENVGYAKVDKAGIYNILIMEEKQSIVAAGAGATTKIVIPEEQILRDEKTGKEKWIARVENVKDIEQYIERIDEMIERKGEWLWL